MRADQEAATHQVTNPHTALDFLGFMRKVVRAYPDQELHVILDNSSTHSTDDVAAWLAENPQVTFHYTPTSASWLNQVEGFFGILGKQSLSTVDFRPLDETDRRHQQEPRANA
ncbi:MAG: transposase [Myxococcales bacterium]|nr:transposase [Myxococcales bacterium]